MAQYPNYFRNARFERIDHEEVPESKHTLFVRGLPGHVKTDEVKDFFEDHVGPCSFDFIKLSQDQLKLFVAVRFETRDAAKECMHKYKDGEVLGYPVELSWFRDIRRYMSYQQSQAAEGVRPVIATRGRGGFINRGGGGAFNVRPIYDRLAARNEYSFREDEYERGGAKRMRTISSGDRRSDSKRSRSRSESTSQSRSHSSRRSSHERSRSIDSRRSGGASDARSHSRSPTSSSSTPPQAPAQNRQPVVNSPTPKRTVEIIEKGSTPPLPPSPPPPSSIVVKRAISKENSPQRSRSAQQSAADSRSPSAAAAAAAAGAAAAIVERNERKSRKSKKDKKKRKRRSPSTSSSQQSSSDSLLDGRSSGELSEGELRKKILRKREKALRGEENAAAAEAVLKANGKTTLGKWEEKSPLENTQSARPDSSLLQNTTLKFGLESNEDIPKHFVRDPQSQSQASLNSKKPTPANQFASNQYVTNASVRQEPEDMQISPPPVSSARASKSSETAVSDTSSFPKKAINRDFGTLFNTDIDALLGKQRSSASVSQNASSLFDDLKTAPTTNTYASLSRTQQQQQQNAQQIAVRSILDENDEPVQSPSGLRLSTFARQLNAESERDRKLGLLPPEMLSKFVAKKKQFDMAFKSDCETFALVVKTLIQKDPGLEERLRLALAEAIKDMEDSFTQKVDQFLDQLIMIAKL